jgi:hypothetical protein
MKEKRGAGESCLQKRLVYSKGSCPLRLLIESYLGRSLDLRTCHGFLRIERIAAGSVPVALLVPLTGRARNSGATADQLSMTSGTEVQSTFLQPCLEVAAERQTMKC